MPDTREERIRQEAFLLWSADGRPEGHADQSWHQAERVIDHQDKLLKEADHRGEV